MVAALEHLEKYQICLPGSASNGSGTSAWKMNNSCPARFLKASLATPEFFESTSRGRCAMESLKSTVSDNQLSQ
jgi:hypothetical protein